MKKYSRLRSDNMPDAHRKKGERRDFFDKTRGEPIEEVRVQEQVYVVEADEREWMPPPARITIIQRDAPPAAAFFVKRKQSSAIIKLHHAVATTRKSSIDNKGISFAREDSDSPLRIKEIHPDGPFASSGLSSSMAVMAINGRYMTWSSPEAAMQELGRGEIMKVTAEDAPSKLYRKAYTMNVEIDVQGCIGGFGVTFARKGDDFPLFIHHIEEDGPFQDLLPGMKVLAINDQFMTWESPERAFETLSLTQGGMTRFTVEATVETVNMMMHKIDLEMSASKEVYISGVTSYSERCTCDLKKGMKVLVLNGHVCNESTSIDEMIESYGDKWDVVAVDLDCQKTTVQAGASNHKEHPLRVFSPLNADLLIDCRDMGMEQAVSNAMGQCIYGMKSALGEDLKDEEPTTKKGDDKSNSKSIAPPVSVFGEAKNNEPISPSSEQAGNVPYDEPHPIATKGEVAGDVKNDESVPRDVGAQNDRAITLIGGEVAGDVKNNKSVSRDVGTQNDRAITLIRDEEGGVSRDVKNNEPESTPSAAAERSEEIEYSNSEGPIPAKSAPVKDVKTDTPFFIHQENGGKESQQMICSYQIKKVCNEDVGLVLTLGHNSGIYISTIENYSKFRSTGLKTGMRIDSINGITCPNSMRVTTALINAVDGSFELGATFGGKPKAAMRHEIFFTQY
jgi:hypothetical protein